jgi:hypothetical protein
MYDLKVCDYVMLIQLLCFWTLYFVLFLFKTHSVSETELYLRLQVKRTHQSVWPIEYSRTGPVRERD